MNEFFYFKVTLLSCSITFFAVYLFLNTYLAELCARNSKHASRPAREERKQPAHPLHCYSHNGTATLPEIREPGARSIFFLETSCRSHDAGRIVLGQRHACAVESAALMNPTHDIYVLFASPTTVTHRGDQNDKILSALSSYPNMHFRHLNFDKHMRGSPLDGLHKSGRLFTSKWPVSHASDLLRYLTLWMYGGIYMDLDVVIKSSFADAGQNFAGRQSDSEVAAGVLGFARAGQGHRWAHDCLVDLNKGFQPKIWGYNGPGTIQRLLAKVCNKTKPHDMNRSKCQGFEVYPPPILYPIPYYKWKWYFAKDKFNSTMKQIATSKAIHLWGMLSSGTKVKYKELSTVYEVLSMTYCPKVYRLSAAEL